MNHSARLRGVAAIVVACVLGVLGAGSLFAGPAFADGGSGSTPSPVTVTIPGNVTSTPTPTPSPGSSSSSTSGSPSSGGYGGGAGTVATPPHQPGTAPRIPKHPAVGTLRVTIEPAALFGAGDWMTVTAAGFNPGEKVQLVLYYERGKPVRVGDFEATTSGSFAQAFILPQLDAGTDTVQLTGWDSSKVGTASFLLGASWVAPRSIFQRVIWPLVGGVAGLGAFAALVWFGFASLRRRPAAEVGV